MGAQLVAVVCGAPHLAVPLLRDRLDDDLLPPHLDRGVARAPFGDQSRPQAVMPIDPPVGFVALRALGAARAPRRRGCILVAEGLWGGGGVLGGCDGGAVAAASPSDCYPGTQRATTGHPILHMR